MKQAKKCKNHTEWWRDKSDSQNTQKIHWHCNNKEVDGYGGQGWVTGVQNESSDTATEALLRDVHPFLCHFYDLPTACPQISKLPTFAKQCRIVQNFYNVESGRSQLRGTWHKIMLVYFSSLRLKRSCIFNAILICYKIVSQTHLTVTCSFHRQIHKIEQKTGKMANTDVTITKISLTLGVFKLIA